MKQLVIVAASNAPAKVKEIADYICDGIDDQIEIQAALDTAGDLGCHIVFYGDFLPIPGLPLVGR